MTLEALPAKASSCVRGCCRHGSGICRTLAGSCCASVGRRHSSASYRRALVGCRCIFMGRRRGSASYRRAFARCYCALVGCCHVFEDAAARSWGGYCVPEGRYRILQPQIVEFDFTTVDSGLKMLGGRLGSRFEVRRLGTEARGPRIGAKNRGPRTRSQGSRTGGQGPRTKSQGPRTEDQGLRLVACDLRNAVQWRCSSEKGGTS